MPAGRTRAEYGTIDQVLRVDPLSSRWLAHARRGATRAVAPAVRATGWVARHPRTHRYARRLGVFAVALAGVALGVLLAGRVKADVGPFRAEFAVVPSLTGGTEVAIPPLGSLHLASHSGPAHFVVRLEDLDQKRTTALVRDPNGLSRASDDAVTDVDRGVHRLALQVAGVSVLGAMLAGALVYRNMRRTAECGGLAEPRYEGLLTNAPAVVGDARKIAGQYEEYRAELQRLVQNVSRIYGTVSALPVYSPDAITIRVLHISDMHLNPAAWSVVQTVVQQFNIDVVVDTGDITDWGSIPEDSYVANIASLKVPYIFVRGNHDSALTAAAVARQPNAKVLDNAVITVDGLTIAGIGDPRFTPDKSTDQHAGSKTPDQLVLESGRKLADTVVRQSAETHKPVDIVMVHDPASTQPLVGRCPLVLAGHLHARDVSVLDPDKGAQVQFPYTRLMVEGSTGGAGLRGLESTEPLPLALSVLYFDKTHTVAAYDDIKVGGTGQTQVALERHIVKPPTKPGPSASPSPSVSGS